MEIVREVAAEQDLHFRMATIQAATRQEGIDGQAEPWRNLGFQKPGCGLAASVIDACTRIVGQMGVEPIISALDQGAEVVLAGRAFDAALTAALPIMRGVDRGLAFHMGKIVECGSLVALPRTSDGVIAHIYSDHFLIEPADPAKRCLVDLVTVHTLYEKSDPYHLAMPGGTSRI